ncbi:hypothetical protein PoB_007343600 [Plakobranchus ocellatus]|uniref:Uncharacterized protein n=1 Tax=Plakobranchus ocellatus TaxID=259542 RepID=A0AAV4DSQ4_9GAST|nr:hypothetical protein PoB_007343600 [Plakobranchus ocellatus]
MTEFKVNSRSGTGIEQLHFSALGVGGRVLTEPVLRSVITFLRQVQNQLLVPWPDGGLKASDHDVVDRLYEASYIIPQCVS